MTTLALNHETPDGRFEFHLDPRIQRPESFRVAFLILLDGDLVMSPEHLGVALMAAVLRRAGFKVRIFEVLHERYEDVLREILQYKPNLACFTLMSLNMASCLRFCQRLHDILPGLHIICGGPAGTYAGNDVLEHNPYVNVVAIGEGEPTIFELVKRIYLGEPIESCPGICYRGSDSMPRRNATRPLMHNLDDLPFPARDQFEAHGNRLEYLRVSTSRGCVAQCTFCSAPHTGNRVQTGKAWRGRSVKSVLDELSELVDRYGFRTFDFVDSTFEDPDGGPIGKGRIARIAEGILERKLDIYYNCCMRAENWMEDDAELIDLLARSGLEKVNVGIESANESELRLWRKRATVEDNIRIIRLLEEHRIYLAMGFIQFHPYSSLETLTNNARFLRDHAGHNLRRMTERLEIYPGTPLVWQLEADGLLGNEFHRTLNPYDYYFFDERVARVAQHFASLYNNDDYHKSGVITEQSSVFRFETFNVVVATYISRIYRQFHEIPAAKEVVAHFQSDVRQIKQDMGQFNYEFFMENLNDVVVDRHDPSKRRRQVNQVERYFAQKIEEIKNRQLQCSRALSRLGCNLSLIASLVRPSPQSLRTYTGGGTPCW